MMYGWDAYELAFRFSFELYMLGVSSLQLPYQNRSTKYCTEISIFQNLILIRTKIFNMLKNRFGTVGNSTLPKILSYFQKNN